MNDSSLKCKEKKRDECVKKGKLCNLDNNRCGDPTYIKGKLEKEDLKVDTKRGVYGKEKAMMLVNQYLKPIDKESQKIFSKQLGEVEVSVPTRVSPVRSVPSSPKSPTTSELLGLGEDDSPDDFGDGPVQKSDGKLTSKQIKKLTKAKIIEELKKYGQEGDMKMLKDDLVILLEKTQNSGVGKTVKTTARTTKTATKTTVKESPKKNDDPEPSIYIKKKYRGLTVPKLVIKLNEEYGQDFKQKTRRNILLNKLEELENQKRQMVEECKKCDDDEVCDIDTGECERPGKGTDLYVLIHDNTKIRGSKDQLENLAKTMEFVGYRIEKLRTTLRSARTNSEDFEEEIVFERPVPRRLVSKPSLPSASVSPQVQQSYYPVDVPDVPDVPDISPSLPQPSQLPPLPVDSEDSEEIMFGPNLPSQLDTSDSEDFEEEILFKPGEMRRMVTKPSLSEDFEEEIVYGTDFPRPTATKLTSNSPLRQKSMRIPPEQSMRIRGERVSSISPPELSFPEDLEEEELLDYLQQRTMNIPDKVKKDEPIVIRKRKTYPKRDFENLPMIQLKDIADKLGLETENIDRRTLIQNIQKNQQEDLTPLDKRRNEARYDPNEFREKLREEEQARDIIERKSIELSERESIPDLVSLAEIVSGRKPESKEGAKLINQIKEFVGI